MESQIDHVLMSPKNVLVCTALSASWSTIRTDHKLLLASLKFSKKINNNKCNSPTKQNKGNSNSRKDAKQLQWSIQNLKDENTRLAYKINLNSNLKTLTSKKEAVSISEKWEGLKECIKSSAANVLNRPTSPLTPRRRKAIAKFEQMKFKTSRDPANQSLQKELRVARKMKFEANQTHIGEQCDTFFKNLDGHHPGESIQKTFKFLARFKRVSTQPTNKTFIPISNWHKELKASSVNDRVEFLPEIPSEIRDFH